MSSLFGWHGASLGDLALILIIPGAIGAGALCAAAIEVCAPLGSVAGSALAPDMAGIGITTSGYGGSFVGAGVAGRLVGDLGEDGGEDGS